jgi:hypothetical protein
VRKNGYTQSASHLYNNLTQQKSLSSKELNWMADNYFLPSLHR